MLQWIFKSPSIRRMERALERALSESKAQGLSIRTNGFGISVTDKGIYYASSFYKSVCPVGALLIDEEEVESTITRNAARLLKVTTDMVDCFTLGFDNCSLTRNRNRAAFNLGKSMRRKHVGV